MLARGILPVEAASTYTVDSTGDQSDDNPGDDSCHTAVNTCTLRAAIQEANAHSGDDIINFGISGSGLHTIQPASALPDVTGEVVINGYSQTGSAVNTAVSPNPFNGTLTIELDGQNAGTASGLNFGSGSSGSAARGLVINRFEEDGIRISTDNITVQGNYLGTNNTGLTALGNNGGIQQGTNDSDNAQIGGLDPEDRNIISGNTQCGSSPNTNSDNWVYEGNYIGPDAAGTGALGNGSTSGCGGLSIDNNEGTIIGGTSPGATNVISGNGGGGVQPDNTDGTTVQGNLIGTDYTGTVDLANGADGVSFSQTNTNGVVGGTSIAARNIISANTGYGVTINQGGSGIVVQGNYIGTDITGTQPLGNGTAGVRILGASNNIVGGTSSSARNIISANNEQGILILGTGPFGGADASNNVVQGNYVGTDVNGQVQSGLGNVIMGVAFVAAPSENLVGGITTGSGNLIAGNGSGIFNAGFVGADEDLNNAFLGNSIHSNSGGPVTTLGIDLANTLDGSSFTNTGVTANDAGDTDISTNHYMNFPVISSISSSNGTATITYSLDINDTETGATGYRIEFFANDSADASGHGQGQTYIGADTVSGDVTNRQVTITLPSGISGSKYISAVTTMTTNSTNSGFGHSSEFAANVQATLVAATESGGSGSSSSASSIGLADTGDNEKQILLIATLLLMAGTVGSGVYLRRRETSISK